MATLQGLKSSASLNIATEGIGSLTKSQYLADLQEFGVGSAIRRAADGISPLAKAQHLVDLPEFASESAAQLAALNLGSLAATQNLADLHGLGVESAFQRAAHEIGPLATAQHLANLPEFAPGSAAQLAAVNLGSLAATQHLANLQGLAAESAIQRAADDIGHLATAQHLANLPEFVSDSAAHRATENLGSLAATQHLADLQGLGAESAIQRATGGIGSFIPVQHLVEQNEFGTQSALHLASESIVSLATTHHLADLPELGAAGAIRLAVESLDSLKTFQGLLSPQLTGLYSSMGAAQGLYEIPSIKALLDLQASRISDSYILPLVQNLSTISGLPFDRDIVRAAIDVASYAGKSESENHYSYIEGIEETKTELASSSDSLDFNSLSLKAQKVLISILTLIVVPFLVSIMAAIAYDKLKNRIEGYGEIATSREVRRLTKCEDVFERESLSQCRIVSGHDVKLRIKPNQKAYSIATVPIGTPVNIIDSSSRSWLKVEIISEEIYIEGWLLRRYTERFR